MEQAVAVMRDGRELWFALHLEHLHPDRRLDPQQVARDEVAFVMSMDGHDDARFTLQKLARPEPSGLGGRLDIDLIVCLESTGEGSPSLDRVSDLCDDLLDMASAPPVRWSLAPVCDDDALARILDPVEARHFAEVARREEPCPPSRWSGPAGFAQTPGPRAEDGELWSLWTLGPPSADLRRLASVLLAQEHPVCVRSVLRPSRLAAAERDGIEELVREHSGVVPDAGLLRSSLDTIEALLYLRPTFEARCVVASEAPISRSLLSAIGHSTSEAARHGEPGRGVLKGGFTVERGRDAAELDSIRSTYTELKPGPPLRGLSPAPLRRIRHLLGPWEASHLFRIPATDDDFPGIRSLDTPTLDPSGTALPSEGHLVGQMIGHGQPAVRLGPEDRFRHMYISGQTGTGKSTLLFNLAMQDIRSGAGVAVLDPHGDLVESLLRNIPSDRIDDVVLVDPADDTAVVGVNLLEAETPVQREYVVSELCAMFYALFDPQRQGIIGPRYETMLRQAANLLLANPEQPSSFLDISTPFADSAVRDFLVAGVQDPILAEFWQGEMRMERSRDWGEIVGWFRSKFEVFRTSALVRNVVGQAESTISFSEVLQQQRILLVNLSKGMLGQYNSELIGYIVFTRLWSAALERASVPVSQRPDFFVYIDEFQNMTSDSLPDVLSEARKFRVGMTLANQFFSQIRTETRDAILGNVGSRITFRVGPKDAAGFAGWMGNAIHSEDLIRLPNYTAIVAASNDGVPLDPVAMQTNPPDDHGTEADGGRARQRSREQWARPLGELDPDFFTRWRHVPGSISAKVGGAAPAIDGTDDPSFLDRWLAKRSDISRGETEPGCSIRISGSIAGREIELGQVLSGALPRLSAASVVSIVQAIPGGAEVGHLTPETADLLVEQVGSMGLGAERIDDD